MESPAAAPRRRPRWPGPGAVLLLALLVWCLKVLIPHVHAVAGGSDSAGYLTQARLISEGRIRVPPRTLPGVDPAHFSEFLYSPLGMKPSGPNLVPTYPVGLPLLIAGAAAVTGWNHAADIVIVLHALLALVFLYGFARELGLGWRGAITACIALAASPLFLYFSVQAMSDVPALAWTAATAWAAWRARPGRELGDAESGPRRMGWAVVAGGCLSIAVLIRPTNILMALPLIVVWWPDLRLAALCVLGGLPGAACFLAYNHAAYGGAFVTGYGEAGTLFQWAVVRETLHAYWDWLPIAFTHAVALCVLLFFRARREAWFLLAWAAAYLGFYVFYYHTHEAWWYLRFILPAAPALIVGWIWGARTVIAALTAKRPPPAWARTAAAMLLCWGLCRAERKWDRNYAVLDMGEGENTYPLTLAWFKNYAPNDAVLLCMQVSGAAYFYSDRTLLRWDEIGPGRFPEVARAAAAANRALYAPLFPFEEERALREHMPGAWKPAAHINDVTIWEYVANPRTR